MPPSNPTSTLAYAEAGVPQPIDDDAMRPVTESRGTMVLGDSIGRYRIESQLGRGGMGVVYAARDTALGRRVALKLVRPGRRPSPCDSQFVERLRREAQALARLSHPNVVALYDLGIANNLVFLAMEFIEGDHLGRYLLHEKPPWRQVVALFIDAGRGLAAAHAAGIVHRDFKPTNVLVSPDRHVTVVDFGLARGTDPTAPLAPERSGDARRTAGDDDDDDDDDERCDTLDEDDLDLLLGKKLTDANVIIGTRGYMAPEQLLGLPVGAAADQFALCVSLYEALYQIRPYPGRTAVETARAFAAGNLEQPRDRRGVSESIHAALLRGLSVEPNQRFPSMNALLSALRIETATDENRLPKHRTRRASMAAVVVVTALASAVTTAAVSAWIDQPQAPSNSVAAAGAVCEPAATAP